MFSIHYIASESNQVCLWLPYVLNTTMSRLFFPILLRAAWQWACDDVCSAVYRYYFCTNCTSTQCLLPALKGEGRFASWAILIGCAKTDGPITGNITGSFCILLQTNTAWPSYRRIARSISNKYINWRLSLEELSAKVRYKTVFRFILLYDWQVSFSLASLLTNRQASSPQLLETQCGPSPVSMWDRLHGDGSSSLSPRSEVLR